MPESLSRVKMKSELWQKHLIKWGIISILSEKCSFDNYEVEHDFATIGRRTMLLNARQIDRKMGKERIILLAIEDITERKQAEEQIKASLKEKETLLKETHHRVKNNLTVVASLLSLEANNINDKRLSAALMDSKTRVQSMSDIHEVLYKSENLSALDMNSYLTKLTRDVIQNYTLNTKTERANVMTRVFNNRQGFGRDDDCIIERWYEKLTKGAAKGRNIDRK